MDSGEENRLRALYETWPTVRLAYAVEKERSEYTPEAVGLLLQELKKRKIEENQLPSIVASIPPAAEPRGTRFRPISLNRTQYLVRWLLWLVAMLSIGLTTITIFKTSDGLSLAGPLVVGVVYKIVCMDMPRLKNAGLSPWLLFLMVVPVVNFFFLAVLFFAPPEGQR